MSDRFSCQDKDSLIAYLYDEVELPLRQHIEAHLRSCRACAEELDSLAMVRTGLSAWTPPEVELGITIARKGDVVRPARWWSEIPAWAQAAAAVFVLAVGLGAANIQVRSGADGVVVTTGWMTPSARVPVTRNPIGEESWRPALAALESQLRGELQANRAPAAEPMTVTTRADGDVVLKQVQSMLVASELQQRQELALRLTQLTRDMDIQRRADLVRISRGFGQFEGRTGEMEARQRQMINYITRVSGQPQQ